jgi:hypothetical protein
VNVERELRSKFSEAAAESHVADVQDFEHQLQMLKEDADNKIVKQNEEIAQLKAAVMERDGNVGTLEGNGLMNDLCDNLI